MPARLIEAAAGMLARSRYGWLTTEGEDAVAARPMGRLPPAPDDDAWLVRFVTDARSRKIAQLGARVTLAFHDEAKHAWLSLQGAPTLRPRAAENGKLWRDAYAAYFPKPGDKAHAAFLEIRADRLDLWMRGVTPEPFGLSTTSLARDRTGEWRLV